MSLDGLDSFVSGLLPLVSTASRAHRQSRWPAMGPADALAVVG